MDDWVPSLSRAQIAALARLQGTGKAVVLGPPAGVDGVGVVLNNGDQYIIGPDGDVSRTSGLKSANADPQAVRDFRSLIAFLGDLQAKIDERPDTARPATPQHLLAGIEEWLIDEEPPEASWTMIARMIRAAVLVED